MQASLVCHHRHHHSHNPVDAGRGRRRQLSSSMRSMQSALSAMTRPREVRAGLETQPSWGRVVPKLVFCTSLPSIGVPVRPQVSERSSGPCSNCLTSSMVSTPALTSRLGLPSCNKLPCIVFGRIVFSSGLALVHIMPYALMCSGVGWYQVHSASTSRLLMLSGLPPTFIYFSTVLHLCDR
jgi:hypothetical protein